MQERIEDDCNDCMILEVDDVLIFLNPAKEYLVYVENRIQHYLDAINQSIKINKTLFVFYNSLIFFQGKEITLHALNPTPHGFTAKP